MILQKTVPGLIKPRDQEAQFVSVKKEISYHPSNGGLVILRVIKGKLKRMLLSKSGKGAEDYHMPANRVFVYPGGLDSGILTPNKTMFVCGVREECHKDMAEKIDSLKQEVKTACDLREESTQMVVDILKDLSQQEIKMDKFEDFEKVWRHKLATITARQHGKKK